MATTPAKKPAKKATPKKPATQTKSVAKPKPKEKTATKPVKEAKPKAAPKKSEAEKAYDAKLEAREKTVQKTALELVHETRVSFANYDLLPLDPDWKGWTGTDVYLIDLLISNGRGLPWGINIEIYGPPAAGKTYWAFLIAMAYLRRGFPVFWFAIEGGWSPDFSDLVDKTLKKNPLFTLYGGCYAEEALDGIVDGYERYENQRTPALFVLDSIARLATVDRVKRGLDENRKGMGNNIPQLLNDFFTKLSKVQTRCNCSCLYINQTYKGMATMPGRPAPEYCKGGSSPEYSAGLRIKVRPFDVEEDSFGAPRFGLINAVVTKSRIQMPGTRAVIPLFFKQTSSRIWGMDDAFSSLLFLLQHKGLKFAKGEKVKEESSDGTKSKKATELIKVDYDGEEVSIRELRDAMLESPEFTREIRDLVAKTFRKRYRMLVEEVSHEPETDDEGEALEPDDEDDLEDEDED